MVKFDILGYSDVVKLDILRYSDLVEIDILGYSDVVRCCHRLMASMESG